MRRRLLLTAAVAVAAGGPASLALATGGTVNLLTVLAKPLASAERGKVRVLIPGRLDAGFTAYAAAHLHASGGRTAGGYDIELAQAPDCDDATACLVAEFAAGKGQLAFTTKVALSRGIVGAFHGISCGASCAPATIEWLEYGSLYEIQYGGGESQMIALADSAITAGPRHETGTP
jgi:hypothetical protein